MAKMLNTQYLIQIYLFLSYPIITMLLSEVNLGPDPASVKLEGSRVASSTTSVSYTGLAAHPVFFSSETNPLLWRV